MDLLVFLLTGGCVSALVVGGALAAWSLLRRQQTRSAERLATALGLTATGATIDGTLDGRTLRIRPESRGTGRSRRTVQVLEVDVPELPAGLRLAVQRSVVGLGGAGPDRTLGDPAFDAAYRVEMDDAHVAWLDAATRDGLRAARIGALGDGVLQVERDAVYSAEHVREVVAVANQLVRRDPTEALQRIAARDPAPRVRILALEVLTRDAAGADVSLLLLDLARTTDPLVRAAATALAGRVEDLAHQTGRLLSDTDRCVLFGLLERRGTGPLVARALDGLSAPATRPAWFAATAAAAAHPDDEVGAAVDRAATRLATGADAAFVADRALHALLAGPAANGPHVVRWLGLADRAVPEALAWLAAHGTVEAVPALDAFIADTWPLGATRRAAEAAKAAIQDRAGGDRGDLSLADADARGALAEDPAAAGRLAEARRVPER